MPNKRKKMEIKSEVNISKDNIKKTEKVSVDASENTTVKISNKKNAKTISVVDEPRSKEVLSDSKSNSTKRIIGKIKLAAKKPSLKSTKVVSDSGLQGKKTKVLKKDNTGKLLVALSGISLLLVMIVMGQFFILESGDPSNTLTKGTIINGVNVGGLSYTAAEELLADVFRQKSDNFKLNITYEDRVWSFDKNDFKVNSEIHTIIEEAQKRDQINSSYQNQTEKLEELKKQGVSINVAFNYVFVGLDNKIDEIISEVEVEPVSSMIVFDKSKRQASSLPFYLYPLCEARINIKLYFILISMLKCI